MIQWQGWCMMCNLTAGGRGGLMICDLMAGWLCDL